MNLSAKPRNCLGVISKTESSEIIAHRIILRYNILRYSIFNYGKP